MIGLFAQDSASSNNKYSSNQNKKNAKKERINNLLKMEEEGDLIFNKHNIFGIRLATDGYGISFEKGRFKTPSRVLLYQFELNEKKSPKEHRTSASSDQFNYSSIVPYKLNNVYEFKVAIGQQHLIGGKGNRNGVAVTALYSGGLSLAMLKPYYINVSGTPGRVTFDQWYKDSATGQINGPAGPFVGWDHLSVKPGVNGKTAMRFDYARLNQTVTAIEVGLTYEYYFGKITQMWQVPPKQFFFNAYLSILFGSRK